MSQALSLFVGSSTEALRIAEAVANNLKSRGNLTVNLWKKVGLFPPGRFLPERLKEIATTYDFAVLIFSPDDEIISHGVKGYAPRDNIVFELGLFAGLLGHERTFAVVHKDDQPKLPVDFLGVSYVTYTTATDPAGDLVPTVGSACDQISQAVAQQGSLHHPKFDPALFEITENVRRASKVEHPLFLSRFERWCDEEIDASKHFGQGLLRISADYAAFLASAFRGAEKNIFSTSGPALKSLWNQTPARLILDAQQKNDNPSSRVFIYDQGEDVAPNDIKVMKLHQSYGVEVRVYENFSDPFLNFDPENIENQFDIIDDGKAIGILKDVSPKKREAYWYFDDPHKAKQYRYLRDTLIQISRPLDDWLVQHAEAA